MYSLNLILKCYPQRNSRKWIPTTSKLLWNTLIKLQHSGQTSGMSKWADFWHLHANFLRNISQENIGNKNTNKIRGRNWNVKGNNTRKRENSRLFWNPKLIQVRLLLLSYYCFKLYQESYTPLKLHDLLARMVVSNLWDNSVLKAWKY